RDRSRERRSGGGEEEWQEVRGRRDRRSKRLNSRPDIATNPKASNYDRDTLTTYFFSDFPEDFGAKAMYNIFQKYGDIVEVVIPAKRDKGGRRFGFARFEAV
ncbi:RNA-binding protein 25-like, partial [Trifolium medium]|nr:RNA-binding protein 25-like [Trifolium medium]